MTMNGICKYCGTMQMVNAETLEEANVKASQHCTCEGADREMKLLAVRDVVNDLMGEGALERGFSTCTIRQMEMVNELAELVVDDVIKKASLALDTSNITISKGLDTVKINRNKKTSICLEA